MLIERTVTVASRSGLHARPAALFVKAATAQPVRIRLRVGDGPAADARSILAVLALRVDHGATVTLSADDADTDDGAADRALEALADLLARDLDAEPVEG
ncbi:MAG TPA: HPr family phosphocarrier protein [Actinocrinis sp.]|uniref:HPr family phosphocarrier protein n=1 Tax=Actinocrinis sp. TaxID=1920516 RepID=UPI002DDCB274|nr:HPr family phosphocarrier protein [Actinocrinis sp.]HEV2342945.1 HPr family phosphocarrier protein [Actinocrinis sp.]